MVRAMSLVGVSFSGSDASRNRNHPLQSRRHGTAAALILATALT